MRFIDYLNAKPKFFILFISIIILLLLSLLDYYNGKEISLGIFYLVPVSLSTWYINKWYGYAVAGVGSVSEFFIEMQTGSIYTSSIIAYWNEVIIVGFFVIFIIILDMLKRTLDTTQLNSHTDTLTGLANRRYFMELAEAEMQRSSRYNHPFTVAYIDLDNFKSINDKYGHNTGDKLLKTVAATFKTNLRETDVTGRLGGDEFVLLFPEADHRHARDIVTRLEDSLKNSMKTNGWEIVTFSIGVVTFCVPPDSLDDLLKEADDLMYSIKKTTKNNVRYEVVGEYQRLHNSVFNPRKNPTFFR